VKFKSKAAALGLAMLAASISGDVARALDYPARRISLIVPFYPGEGTQGMVRVVAERLGERLGQAVTVDNRGAASGIVAARSAAKATPDGYTLMLGHTGSVGINPVLYRNAGFDTLKDFESVGLIATMPLALLVHPAIPARNIGELIALARRRPGTLSIGTTLKGTPPYMCAEMFMRAAGVTANLIPYKSVGHVLTDLMGGHIQATFTVIPPAFGGIRSGRLRPITVTGAAPTALLPGVPAATESGLPGFDVVLNYGLLAPSGTPRRIVDKLNQALWAVLADDDVKKRILADGAEVKSSTPKEYAAILERDLARWEELIAALNLRID
jgi:tripartite-type tricarboxylate transporter receptor subunit TctC